MNFLKRTFLIAIITILFSCNEKNEIETTVKTNHIKYFGFTLVDTYWDDPTDAETKTNYIDEVYEFSNIADILVVNPTDNIIERMNLMNAHQVKSVLNIVELFFEVVGTSSPSGIEYSLRTDYQSRWDNFVSINNIESNASLIQSFYLGEEPTWNGISFSELKAASDYIKSSIPEIPILIIEAYPAVNELQVPNSVDWIGFDHYFIKDPNTDVTYLNELEVLKSKFTTSEQKLVLVLDAHYIASIHGDFAAIALNDMEQVANSYYQLAKSQPKTIAILNYFWPSGFDLPESIGARHMPENIKQNYIRIGKEITDKD